MSIRKDNRGKYIIDVSAGFDNLTGKRLKKIRKGITTYAEAQIIEKQLREELSDRTHISKQKLIIADLWRHYKEEILLNHKISHVQTQEYNYKAHIIPYFENANIKKLNKNDVVEFREYLLAINLSPNTCNKITILLKKILDIGVEKHMLKSNPAKGIKKLTIEKQKMDFWTIDEFKHFLSLLDSTEQSYKVFFLTLYFTGIRLGESLALTWKDLNVYKQELEINKSFSIHKGVVTITTPKTKYSNRRISINKSLLDQLVEWKMIQKNTLESYLLKQSDETPIFQFSSNLTNKDLIYRKFASICNRDKNLKKIRIHDFRHSHVALLIDNGEDYTIIKERLGHSSITTTIDVYGHLFPNRQKSTADKLDQFF
ncbi:tyrosine-type recombinase/integrase [Listeria grayi]|uniref:tyrosine-type recombinase/integrase n=1 Tax=Listeria grayi TaxID=1641 RepID=UPI0016290E09|nr:site-specific integrase [Listeria grayi]MBC1923173.1 site-specific integrase [Listeria grayi]